MPVPSGAELRLPSALYLNERLAYDPETGELRWRASGRIAGTVRKGKRADRVVRVDGALQYAHRVIWKMMTGDDPPSSLDHRDGEPGDNRWSQLRGATGTQQNWNTDLTNNKHGRRGVYQRRDGKYVARVQKRFIGSFDTLEEAGDVADAVRRAKAGEFYR